MPLEVLAHASAEGIIKICLGGFIPNYYFSTWKLLYFFMYVYYASHLQKNLSICHFVPLPAQPKCISYDFPLQSTRALLQSHPHQLQPPYRESYQ